MKSAAEENIIVRVDENPVINIYNFCKRHKLLPKFSDDKKRWILRPMPKIKAPILRLVESDGGSKKEPA